MDSPVCEACPQLDPSIAICEGNTVISQPGYYAYFYSEADGSATRRADDFISVAVHQCPNKEACKRPGLLDYVCNTSLRLCNSDSDEDSFKKCDEGYTGSSTVDYTSRLHAASLCESDQLFTGVLCAQCADGWFSGNLVRSPSTLLMNERVFA